MSDHGQSADELDRSVADPGLICAGLPLAGRRVLSPAERRALLRGALSPLPAFGVFILFIASLAAIATLADRSTPRDPLFGLGLLSQLVFAGALLSPLFHQHRLLRSAWVYRFEDESRLVAGDATAPRRVEALIDGRLVSIDGQPPPNPAPDPALARVLTMRLGPAARRVASWWSPGLPPDGSGLWCHGLPRVAQRALTPEEIGELTQRRRGHQRRLWVQLVLPPAVTAAALSAALGDGGELAAAASLVCAVCWVVAWVAMFEHLRWLAALRSALRGGMLSVFVKAQSPNEESSLQLLDGGLLYAVDGYRELGRQRLGVAAVAPTPPSAEMAAQFMEPAQLPSGEVARANRRDLSAAELDELGGMAKPLRWYVGMAVVMAMAALSCRSLWLGVSADAGQLLPSFLFFWIALRLGRVLGSQSELYRAHSADMAACFVVLLDPSDSPDQARAAGVPQGTRFIEVLPHSGRVWTLDGQPAPWRAHANPAR